MHMVERWMFLFRHRKGLFCCDMIDRSGQRSPAWRSCDQQVKQLFSMVCVWSPPLGGRVGQRDRRDKMRPGTKPAWRHFVCSKCREASFLRNFPKDRSFCCIMIVSPFA